MRLPHGFTVALDPRTRRVDGGAGLLGGSPTRYVRLARWARAMLDDDAFEVTFEVTDARSASFAELLLDYGLAQPVVDRLPELPASEAALTFVVPVKDRERSLERLLASIRDAGRDDRVIVVDDGSERPERTEAVAASFAAECLAQPVSLGAAAARNAGLAKVRTPFVVFIDSDAVLTPGALPLLLRHFADPKLAVAAPRILGLGRGSAIERYEAARSSLDLGDTGGLVRPLTRIGWVSSTCMVARVAALGEGFDPSLRVGEDVELCWRLDAGGARVRYEPRAVVIHEHRASLRAWMARKRDYGTGAQRLAELHPEAIAPAVLAPWSAAVLIALAAQRRWSLPVAVAITAVATARIALRLGSAQHPLRLAARLAGLGTASTLAQGSALLLRHWWPAAALACVISRRARRAVAVAAVADAAAEYLRLRPELDPLRFAVLRRLDDLAYGAGVWASALRARSPAALRPAIRRSIRRPKA